VFIDLTDSFNPATPDKKTNLSASKNRKVYSGEGASYLAEYERYATEPGNVGQPYAVGIDQMNAMLKNGDLDFDAYGVAIAGRRGNPEAKRNANEYEGGDVNGR
jgi:hypothetical protein